MLYEMFEEEQCLKYIEVKWVRLQKYFFFYFLLYKRYLVLINILKNGVVDEDEDFFGHKFQDGRCHTVFLTF